MPKKASKAFLKQVREKYWPEEKLWTGAGEGWMKAPRTLPLIMALLSSSELTDKKNVSSVYMELMSRHYDGGIVEMAAPSEHAYAAGYWGERAIRSWLERMEVLEKLGFIKSMEVGNERYKYVALVHPAVVVETLHEKRKIPSEWWNTYTLRKMETKETPPQIRDS